MSRASRGMTLIEITVAMGIAALLFGAIVVSVGSLTGAKAKEATTELAGTVRYLYDTAALTGKTCRLVFDLPADKDEDGVVTYRAECAAKSITTARNRDEELRNAERTRDQKDTDRTEKRFRLSSDEGPTVQELMEAEKKRVDEQAKYASFDSEEVKPRSFPPAVRVSVWTKHQTHAARSGVAYLYFFPQGYTERAQVAVRQGKSVWTLMVSPLTGKVTVVPDEVETPRS